MKTQQVSVDKAAAGIVLHEEPWHTQFLQLRCTILWCFIENPSPPPPSSRGCHPSFKQIEVQPDHAVPLSASKHFKSQNYLITEEVTENSFP